MKAPQRTGVLAVPGRAAAKACRSRRSSRRASTGRRAAQNGATFTVKLESAGLGQANIRKVNLQLPKLAPVPPDDASESLPGCDVRSEPGGVQRRIGHRHRHDPHPRAEEPAGRARLPGLARRRGVPRRRVRAAGRRRSRSSSTARPTSKTGSPTANSKPPRTRRSHVRNRVAGGPATRCSRPTTRRTPTNYSVCGTKL